MENAEHTKLDKKTEREFRRDATRAIERVIASLQSEPAVVIEPGNPERDRDLPVGEITSWLFRRKENGDAGN